MYDIIIDIINMKKYRLGLIYIVLFLVIFHIVQLIQNWSTFLTALDLLGAVEAYKTLFDFKSNYTIFSGAIALLVVSLTSLNILLSIEFFRMRSMAMHHKSNMLTMIGSAVGIMGAHCAACGTVALGALLSIAGVSITALPFEGLEFGVVGIIILSITTYSLYKKYKNPYIC